MHRNNTQIDNVDEQLSEINLNYFYSMPLDTIISTFKKFHTKKEHIFIIRVLSHLYPIILSLSESSMMRDVLPDSSLLFATSETEELNTSDSVFIEDDKCIREKIPVRYAMECALEAFVYPAANNPFIIECAAKIGEVNAVNLLLRYGADRTHAIEGAALGFHIDFACELIKGDKNYDFQDPVIRKLIIRDLASRITYDTKGRYGYHSVVTKLVEEDETCRADAIKGAVKGGDIPFILSLITDDNDFDYAILNAASDTNGSISEDTHKLEFVRKIVDINGECSRRGLFYAVFNLNDDLFFASLKHNGYKYTDFSLFIAQLCGRSDLANKLLKMKENVNVKDVWNDSKSMKEDFHEKENGKEIRHDNAPDLNKTNSLLRFKRFPQLITFWKEYYEETGEEKTNVTTPSSGRRQLI